MSARFDLSGRVALVVGGSRGIGRAIAEGLAQEGADVAVAARSEAEITSVVDSIVAGGANATAFPIDLVDTSSVVPFVDEVAGSMGGIDVLVNAVGITRRSPAVDVTEEDWDSVLQVNLKSLFFLSQAVVRYWIGSGRFASVDGPKGKIIHIASLASAIGLPSTTPYSASKSGLLGVTRVLAIELADDMICANAIAPGYIETEMTRSIMNDPVRSARVLDRIPMGRWGTPQDVVGPAVFLAARASDYVTGQVIYVDGGWTAG